MTKQGEGGYIQSIRCYMYPHTDLSHQPPAVQSQHRNLFSAVRSSGDSEARGGTKARARQHALLLI